MKNQRIVGLAAAALWALLLAPPGFAQDTGKPSAAKGAAVAKALDHAMTPGEAQKRLEPMLGSFDVRILTWVDPAKAPLEASASAVSVWVLGQRYVQTMLVGGPSDDAFSAIGYIGYDNAARQYQVAWMDNGSTAITLYTGGFAADGRSAALKASVAGPVSGKPMPVELRMRLGADGGHVTQLWGQGLGTKVFKMMELQYTRTKP
ncbi:MAG: DUF1579 family protein [Rubrivivax sp.]|nr:DUF1579 family protein [Rubrivivax sp.]HOW49577.1 DUF1579 family protein [Rubrivivax sp.]HRY88843.1 DUF1579 family protein [Rubrivivax sp.]